MKKFLFFTGNNLWDYQREIPHHNSASFPFKKDIFLYLQSAFRINFTFYGMTPRQNAMWTIEIVMGSSSSACLSPLNLQRELSVIFANLYEWYIILESLWLVLNHQGKRVDSCMEFYHRRSSADISDRDLSVTVLLRIFLLSIWNLLGTGMSFEKF